MQVELDDGTTADLRICEEDRPEDLAASFIKEHGLNGDAEVQSGGRLFSTLVELIRASRGGC
jgi:hypothetical protein